MPRIDNPGFQPTPVDPARIGERDTPENDWGEPEAGAIHGANHARRTDLPEPRSQGAKTRTASKNRISRRA